MAGKLVLCDCAHCCVDELTLLMRVHRTLFGEENLVVVHEVVGNSLVDYVNLLLAETCYETIGYCIVVEAENYRVFSEVECTFVVLHVGLACAHGDCGLKYLFDGFCLGVERFYFFTCNNAVAELHGDGHFCEHLFAAELH